MLTYTGSYFQLAVQSSQTGEAHHRPGKEMTRMKNKAQQDRHSSIDAPRVNMLPAGLLPFARQKLPGFCAA
jgi:hypothetical protein